jgi:hypothetical protein
MTPGGEHDQPVTDDDVARIIVEHEAGIADVMSAYAAAEHHYMAVAQVQLPVIIASATTQQR